LADVGGGGLKKDGFWWAEMPHPYISGWPNAFPDMGIGRETMVGPEETEVVLRWLRDHEASGSMVFDSDIMSDLQWTLAQTQTTLRAMEDAGDIECRLYVLGRADGVSLGDIYLTRHGRRRLEQAKPVSYLPALLSRLLLA
jgi:hypothetical protein